MKLTGKKAPAKMMKKSPVKKATDKQVAMAKAILAKAGEEEKSAMMMKKSAMKMKKDSAMMMKKAAMKMKKASAMKLKAKPAMKMMKKK